MLKYFAAPCFLSKFLPLLQVIHALLSFGLLRFLVYFSPRCVTHQAASMNFHYFTVDRIFMSQKLNKVKIQNLNVKFVS